MEECWREEDSGKGSRGKKTSGENNKPLHLWEEADYDRERRNDGLQPVRWQIIRRKGQDELLLGSVHPYPSDEQEPKIKPRPVKEEEDRVVSVVWYVREHVGGLSRRGPG